MKGTTIAKQLMWTETVGILSGISSLTAWILNTVKNTMSNTNTACGESCCDVGSCPTKHCF
jgi:hypothetical protein